MNLSLYEIATEYQSAMMKLMDSDMPEEVINDTLEGMSGELEVKATNVGLFIGNLKSNSAAIKEAAKQMLARAKAIDNKVDRMESYILENMVRCNITQIDSPYFTLKVRQNPPSVIIDDAGKIPGEMYVYPDPPAPYPDKRAIGEKLKAGEVIEGAHLERGVRLEIK